MDAADLGVISKSLSGEFQGSRLQEGTPEEARSAGFRGTKRRLPLNGLKAGSSPGLTAGQPPLAAIALFRKYFRDGSLRIAGREPT